jgi:hypothetical protein
MANIIGSHADHYPYHYRYQREHDTRDGSILSRSPAPIRDYTVATVCVVFAIGAAIVLAMIWGMR